MTCGKQEKFFSEKMREYSSIIFISNCHNSIRLIINGVVRLVHTKSSHVSNGGFKIMLKGENSQFFDIHARQSEVSEAQLKLANEVKPLIKQTEEDGDFFDDLNSGKT
jgi:hypothetical protein